MAKKYIYNNKRICKNCHKYFMGGYKNAVFCSVDCMRESYFSNPYKDFHRKYEIDEDTGCWNWNGSICPNGYGRIGHKRKTLRAHRVSFEIYHHKIENNQMFVCHKCDNPRCVNPSHLFLGTCKDNVADMYSKGRNSVRLGSERKESILNEESVKRILLDNRTHKKIAEEFGVTRSCISSVKQRRTWKHVKL